MAPNVALMGRPSNFTGLFVGNWLRFVVGAFADPMA
jgi:hypothetical protein